MEGNRKAYNRAIAEENSKITAAGFYLTDAGNRVELEDQLECIKKTRLFNPTDKVTKEVQRKDSGKMQVCLRSRDSVTAVLDAIAQGYRVGVLNFASAKNPGGGYVVGMSAQEEALCRCSNLYENLLWAKRNTKFYGLAAGTGGWYSDSAILSPEVYFFRDNGMRLLDEVVKASVVTCAAVNVMALQRQGVMQADTWGKVHMVMLRRARRVLEGFKEMGCNYIVLGAWGCGVFRNRAESIARAFQTALNRYEDQFDVVEFAIPGGSNLTEFARVFSV